MSRNVHTVILCEDAQHECFLRRFLLNKGWNKRRFRIEKAPKGHGSGEQFVRERFPKELKEFRKRSYIKQQVLIVMIDGDAGGYDSRLSALNDACKKAGISPRSNDEKVCVFVPTWNIETWFSYLDGDNVDETRSESSRLDKESDCQRHVNALIEMCDKRQLRQTPPKSLEKACCEYSRILSC